MFAVSMTYRLGREETRNIFRCGLSVFCRHSTDVWRLDPLALVRFLASGSRQLLIGRLSPRDLLTLYLSACPSLRAGRAPRDLSASPKQLRKERVASAAIYSTGPSPLCRIPRVFADDCGVFFWHQTKNERYDPSAPDRETRKLILMYQLDACLKYKTLCIIIYIR